MNKKNFSIVVWTFLALLFYACNGGNLTPTINGEKINWPDINTFKFIKNKIATEENVNNSEAAFVLNPSDRKGTVEPYTEIEIPQFAFFYSEGNKKGTPEPCVIIQAEKFDNQILVGAVNFSNNQIVGYLNDFKLFGVNPNRK